MRYPNFGPAVLQSPAGPRAPDTTPHPLSSAIPGRSAQPLRPAAEFAGLGRIYAGLTASRAPCPGRRTTPQGGIFAPRFQRSRAWGRPTPQKADLSRDLVELQLSVR